MEYIIPTYQQLSQLLPLDARMTPPPDETASSPKATDSTLSESSEARSENNMSSDGSASTGASRPQPQSRRHSFYRNRNTHRSSVSATSPVLPQMSLQSLYEERTYLAALFQQYSCRVANLIKQRVEADDYFQALGGGKERRKQRKHLNLLRSKINEAADQEKVIFNRLIELNVEIQTQETQVQVVFQGQGLADRSVSATPSTYSVMSPTFSDVTSPLNATSPDFVPAGYFDSYQAPCQEASFREGILETVEEETEMALACSAGSQDHHDQDITKMEEEEDDWAEARLAAKRVRRLSLPHLQA